MDTNLLFITAAQKQFRYESKKGDLSTEDLFKMDLSRASGFDLDHVAQTIAGQLESVTQKSFVNIKPNPKKALLEMKLEVVKTVIAIKQAEAESARKRAAKLLEVTVIRDAIDQAKKNELAASSVEDLEKRLEKALAEVPA